ncbi:MAG: PAS domain S-box protein [Actinomycetota bacterium]
MSDPLGDLGHGPLRILIVEDDPDHRYLLVRTLEAVYRDRVELLPVASLREAQDAIDNARFSCLVLDLTLGDASGTSALEVLRARTDRPIVVLTGRAELGVRALEAGANAFLHKEEIDTARITRAIEDVLANAAALRERAQFEAIVQTAQLAMMLRDLDGTILTWNAGAEAIFGLTRDEVVGRNWTTIVPPDLAEREEQLTQRALAGEHVDRYETQRVHKDGRLIDVGVSLAATHGPDGRVNGVSVIARDITREKETQRERDLLSGIVDSALVAIVSTDTDGRITSWNRGAEHLFGYEASEVMDRRTTFLLPIDDGTGSEHLIEGRLRGEPIDEIESVRRRKDGSLIDVVITGNDVHDAFGNVVGVAAIYHDVTDFKATQRELERRSGQLAEAQRLARLGSFDLDVATGAVSWSDELYRLFGYDPGEIEMTLDRVFEFMDTDDDRELLQHVLDDALQRRGDFEVGVVARKADRTRVDFTARGTVIKDQFGSLRVIGTAQDITEHKRLEEQLLQSQKMEALGGLAGGIAHDFNNLLAVILNYGHFIADDLPEDNRMRDDINAIIQAAQRGSALVKQLLAFSRKEVVRPEVVNMNLLVSQMQPLLRRLVRESIEIEERLEDDVWDTTADRGQLEQVLLNLVVNARDAISNEGKIVVTTSNVVADETFAAAHPDFRAGRFACVTVSDTGEGMSRETQARIFEPFFTTKARGRGTGLGLATVYGIVKRCGGFISVYSEVGLGTTFKIYLPATFLVRQDEEYEPVQLSMTGRGERVVVVEDEVAVLSLITRILGEHNYEVIPLESPELALVRLQSDDDVALLLTDVVMPQMSGRALSEAADVPTIFMSGYTDSIIEEQGVLQEGVVFLPKPFTADELLSVVRSTIDERVRADRAMAQE